MPGEFPPNLSKSMGADTRPLRNEAHYYSQQLKPPEHNVIYRFHEGTKSRTRSTASRNQVRMTVGFNAVTFCEWQSARSKGEGQERQLCEDAAPSSDRRFAVRWCARIQASTKEALCLSALKKKLAKLHAANMTPKECYDATFGVTRAREHELESERPSKRPRGRPPKTKRTPSQETSSIRLSHSKSMEGAVPTRSRPIKRSYLIDSESEIDSSVPRPLSDEQIAWQLHIDLNTPMLRKRRRSGGRPSASSSEQ